MVLLKFWAMAFRWESSWIGQEVGTYNIRFEVSNPSGGLPETRAIGP